VTVGIIGAVLILVLVPLSFQYVSRNEWAFKKDTKTNSIDLTTVHGPGQYQWGIGFTTVGFPSTLQVVSMASTADDLDVFTDSGQTVSIGVVFRYRLDRALLAKMYNTFGLNYHQRVLAVSKAAMRNAVTNYSLADYTSSRQNISDTLFEALEGALEASAFVIVERQHFSLQYVVLPSVVLEQRVTVFQQTQVQQTNAFKYDATLYRLATAQLVQGVQNNATLVTEQAKLQAERMVAQARAASFQEVESESGRQLAAMAAALGVSYNMTAELVLLNNLLDADMESFSRVTLMVGTRSVVVDV
jgi:regulator of protease activity HflC (stomatin/prohibitin superfamily)